MPKKKKKKKENKIKKIVRITNDNIAQQREEVIAQGKKFKYPFQYTKHRLVVLAILVAALAAVLFGIFGGSFCDHPSYDHPGTVRHPGLSGLFIRALPF